MLLSFEVGYHNEGKGQGHRSKKQEEAEISIRSALTTEHNTFPSEVAYVAVPSLVVIIVTCCAKKWNMSVLLSCTRRKSFQFWGITVVESTCRRTPLPLFFLAVLFKLSGLCTSQGRLLAVVSLFQDNEGCVPL